MNEYKTYKYTGPQYYNGNKIASRSNLFTKAKSWEQAKSNFLFRVANGDIISRYDIVNDFIEEVSANEEINEPIIVKEFCDTCGYRLTDSGDCPICDYNDYEMLDLEG